MALLVEYILCVPATNASIERIFSLISKYWTAEKTQMKVETLLAVLNVKVNIPSDCQEFYDVFKASDTLLDQIHNSEKYL